jgi:hypothetical protein
MCIGFSKLVSNFLHGFYQPATAINEGTDSEGGHLDDSKGTDSDGQLFEDEGGGGPEAEDAEDEDEGNEAEQSDDGEHEKETGAIHYGSIFYFQCSFVHKTDLNFLISLLLCCSSCYLHSKGRR